MPEPVIVLHPTLPPGVRDHLAAVAGVTCTSARDGDEVFAALNAGGNVLVTHTWEDRFLTPSLRWIAGTGAGFEQYPLDRLSAQGVVLTTAAGVHADCVAEHAFALLLALTRRVGEAVRFMEHTRWEPLIGEELAGKTMAIVGLGRIGDAIARRAMSWGVSVVGVKRNPASYSGPVAKVHASSDLVEVCAQADILMLASPARPDGRPVVGAAELDALGAGWIVNIGRGSLVDEAALIKALTSGQLRGAGLDVTCTEPLPQDSPLWRNPKVVITAHNAGASPGFGIRWGKLFDRNLAAFTEGGPWINRLGADIPIGIDR